MRIADVVVGERHRKDMGDLDALARSIADIGLLHPIVVTPDNRLIAGQRRLEACKRLGWDAVPATVVDLANLAIGERDENMVRKDFTPSEAVAIARALEPYERAAAKERQGTRTDLEHPVKFTGSGPDSRALDRTAGAVGMSRPTLTKAQAVVDAAEAEPERYGDLPERMDASGKVDGAYAELRRRQAFEARANQARQESIPATIRQSDAISFLAGLADESISLLLADPPYMTDVDDIAAFAAGWLPLALRKIKPDGRAYVFTGSYPDELHAYLTVLRGYPHTDVLVWGYNNTIGPSPSHDYKRNWQAIFYICGPLAPRLNCRATA